MEQSRWKTPRLRHRSLQWLLPLVVLVVASSAHAQALDGVLAVTNPLGSVFDEVVQVVAKITTIPGRVIGALSPYLGKFQDLTQQLLVNNNVTQATSDLVTVLTNILGVLLNEALPVEKPIVPDEFAREYGFIGERHYVTTPDGYILSTFNIRSPDCETYRAVVAAAPSVLANPTSFLYLKEKSLLFRLARRCFNVWTFSVRGDMFGRNHTSLSDQDPRFWQFTPAEQGRYDLPTQLEYIYNVTGSVMHYLGLDQGGTILFFMNHYHGERYQKLIVYCYLYSPIGYLGRLSSIAFDLIAAGREALTAVGALAFHGELPFMNPVVHSALFNLCVTIAPNACRNLFVLLAGASEEVSAVRLKEALRNVLDSTAISSFRYYLDMVGKIKYMPLPDYGPTENLRRYGTITSPQVRLNATTKDCGFFELSAGRVAVPQDILDTYLALNESARDNYHRIPGFNAIGPLVPENEDAVYSPFEQLLERNVARLAAASK